jgi:secondary thiamine-phosphate synthase enzyme
MIKQIEVALPPMQKGFHNIDHIINNTLNELPETGLLNIFVKHTSAALTITENADPDVLADLNTLLDRIAPEDDPHYRHTLEGLDDMPAHFKTLVTGSSLNVPVSQGRMNLGTWQSIFFCEFRNQGRNRKIVFTLYY